MSVKRWVLYVSAFVSIAVPVSFVAISLAWLIASKIPEAAPYAYWLSGVFCGAFLVALFRQS
jgi:hypothetical protein